MIKKTPPHVILRVENLLRSGMPIAEVAEQLGRTVRSVREIITKYTVGINRLRAEGRDPNSLRL